MRDVCKGILLNPMYKFKYYLSVLTKYDSEFYSMIANFSFYNSLLTISQSLLYNENIHNKPDLEHFYLQDNSHSNMGEVMLMKIDSFQK